MQFQNFEDKVNEYQDMDANAKLSMMQNDKNINRQKDVKDELNVDRMKYAAYLDDDKDNRAQKLAAANAANMQKTNSSAQMAHIEAYLGINPDGTKSAELP